MITSAATWIGLARYSIVWGIGIPGLAAAIFLAWRRRLQPEELALAAGAAVLSLLTELVLGRVQTLVVSKGLADRGADAAVRAKVEKVA